MVAVSQATTAESGKSKGGETMKHCYQVATPDVAVADDVTALQGDLEENFRLLSEIGYDGVEFMTINPAKLDVAEIKALSEKYSLPVVLVCTGEIYGQLRLSFTDKDAVVRRKAIEKVKEIIEFASYFGANINIGRVRGFSDENDPTSSLKLAVRALREVCDYAAPRGVKVLIEHIETMETNFIITVSESCDLVNLVNRENFKIMIDVFAMYHEEQDIYEAIRRYSPQHNLHVHLSDSDRYYPGHRDMDFDKIIKTFREASFDGPFVQEVLQLPDQETAARKCFEHIQPILDKYYAK